jgi:hypothetical protein
MRGALGTQDGFALNLFSGVGWGSEILLENVEL